MFAVVALVAVIVITVSVLVISLILVTLKLKKTQQENDVLNQTIQNLEAGKTSEVLGSPEDSDSDLDPDYRLPYSPESDPECDFDCDACFKDLAPEEDQKVEENVEDEEEFDLEWEQFKVDVAPAGPVPNEQVLVVITCAFDEFYTKGVTNEDGLHVEVVTFKNSPEDVDTWEWKPSDCEECIENVSECLRQNGCDLPVITGEDFDRMVLEEDSGDDADQEDYEEDFELV